MNYFSPWLLRFQRTDGMRGRESVCCLCLLLDLQDADSGRQVLESWRCECALRHTVYCIISPKCGAFLNILFSSLFYDYELIRWGCNRYRRVLFAFFVLHIFDVILILACVSEKEASK